MTLLSGRSGVGGMWDVMRVNGRNINISHEGSGTVIAKGPWPCTICRKGVGLNSI